MSRELAEFCDALRDAVPSPGEGLPDEVFRLVTQLTPMVNVDLLIRDDTGRILLTWRDDWYFPAGWHIPGGIIRLGESAAHRIAEVARKELQTEVEASPEPAAVTEFRYPELPYRSHFISLLYECRLKAPPGIAPETWRFFARMPEDILAPHRKYARFFLE